MLAAAVSLALSGLGRDALKIALGLALAVLIAIAFTVSSVIVVFDEILAVPFASVPVASTPVANPSATARGREIVTLARSQIGVPYVWGGATPAGFDCSGLVQWTYGEVGVSLPRTAQEQYDATTRIGVDALRSGDLVFFAQTYPSSDWITHVGIYIGNGLMIGAPTDGDVVRTMPVLDGFWGAHYAGAGHVGG